MDSSDFFNCVVRVKEEPTEISSTENDREMIDEKSDPKSFQLLPFPSANSTQKVYVSHEIELEDGVEIVVECEDVKPTLNSLAIKIDYDYPNHLRNVKYCNDDKTQNIIKTETLSAVKQELVVDVAEELNLNFDSKLIEQNKKRRTTKNFQNEHNLETHIGIVNSDTTHVCKICRKIFKSKRSMNRHIGSLHKCITYSCDICGKPFSQKYNLKSHIDQVHNSIGNCACDLCGKTFSKKGNLKAHIDSVHDKIIYACVICGKNFSSKSYLKKHIDSLHNGVKHTCNVCGKKFSQKSQLKIHIDSLHNGVEHTCNVCGKKFSHKSQLKIHIDVAHNGVTHTCNLCEKKYSTKSDLKKHIDSLHNGVRHTCDLCEKKVVLWNTPITSWCQGDKFTRSFFRELNDACQELIWQKLVLNAEKFFEGIAAKL
ncbi:zinc finger protein OZF-like [Trichogramma pretiosum]|uniref:zinc finger protein OZF-like n=1 Tax=Trichogramma pretiosum TaxID=7493 RepID=UPI000C718B8E|nr:zinc finger protein OZF-like [Trichogramma pretiosum]